MSSTADKAGTTKARTMSRKRLNIRHREGGRSTDSEAPGGKSEVGLAEFVDDECGQELAYEICPGQVRVVGSQAVEFADALEPLEGELDLPAQSVELEDFVGADLGAERGDDEDVAGGLERERVDAV